MILKVSAQDQLSISQYMYHQPFLNPGAMSSYNNWNGAVFYNNQWIGIDGAPTFFGFTASNPLDESNAVGLTFFQDNIGIDTKTDLTGDYAYNLKINNESNLGLGIGATWRNMKSNFNKIQVNDENDPEFSGGIQTKNFFNMRFGAFYYRDRFYAGLMAPSILNNKINYDNGYNGKTYISFSEIHWLLQLGYQFELNDVWDLNASTFVKEARGASVQVDLNTLLSYKDLFGFGLSYRTNQDLLFLANVSFEHCWKVGYAYTYGFNNLSNYTSGSHEIILVFNMIKPNSSKIVIPRF